MHVHGLFSFARRFEIIRFQCYNDNGLIWARWGECMKTNVVLIGMPGCGKSTCGVLAAKALCRAFVDTDLMIQAEEGMKLQEIIETKGNDYFAAAEDRVLSGVTCQNTVIATGGSAVYYDKAMKHLGSIGLIVYLKISYSEMMSRIHNMKTRGILLAPGETMEALFRRREDLYLKYADVVIDCDNNGVEDTVLKIVNAVTGKAE